MNRCTNCNLHYPMTQRYNCQRGFREGERDQIHRRYQRIGDRSLMKNREYNRKRSQMEGQPRYYENHRTNTSPIDRLIEPRVQHYRLWYENMEGITKGQPNSENELEDHPIEIKDY